MVDYLESIDFIEKFFERKLYGLKGAHDGNVALK